MVTEYIQSEKDLNECYDIKNKYISSVKNINNTSKYVKKLCDIIVNMDRVYKYVHNIAKTLNDNIEKYKDFVFWQKGKIVVKQEIIDDWNFIYSIRNKIEHPDDLKTTFFTRHSKEATMPQVIISNQKYDLLNLAEKSLLSVFVLAKSIVAASFLYNKYVIAFTDETGTKLFSTFKQKNSV